MKPRRSIGKSSTTNIEFECHDSEQVNSVSFVATNMNVMMAGNTLMCAGMDNLLLTKSNVMSLPWRWGSFQGRLALQSSSLHVMKSAWRWKGSREIRHHRTPVHGLWIQSCMPCLMSRLWFRAEVCVGFKLQLEIKALKCQFCRYR